MLFRFMTRLPELEMLRERAMAVLTDENKIQLLVAVPFAVGAEHVTEHWLDMVFDRLNDIFQKDMSAFGR